jgi:hypothetical protein
MLTTLTRRDVETVDALLRSFQYWNTVGDRSTETHVPNLRHSYRGHWFNADTLRFFGSRNLHLHRPGILVETQTEAPNGTEYAVTVWVHEEGNVTPQNVGRFDTLRAARRFAESVADVWPVFGAAHALRAAGCPADTAELVQLVAA